MAEPEPPSNIVPIRKPLTPEQEREAQAFIQRLLSAAAPATRMRIELPRGARAPRSAEFMMYGSLAAIIAIAAARWLIWGG